MDDSEIAYDMSPDPDREAELHSKAWRGLQSADLAPLASLLRSEFEIEATLRIAIADAIDGKSAACQIDSRRTQRGKPVEDEGAAMWRDLQIEVFVNSRALSRRQKKAAIADASAEFGIGRSRIFKACKRANALRASLAEKQRTALDAILGRKKNGREMSSPEKGRDLP